MIYEYITLELSLKTYGRDEILDIKTHHGPTTRHNVSKNIQIDYKKGKKSLLSTGIGLFNK